jgi:preprotein translocase subunit SecG
MATAKKAVKPSASKGSSTFLSKLTIVLGLLSIATMWLWGITGVALGYLNLRLIEKAAAQKGQGNSAQNIKTAKILTYFGMGIGAVYFLMILTKWILSAI